MPRLHLLEIHDCSWCPRVVRDGLTNFLQAAIDFLDVYGPIREQLMQAVAESQSHRVIDLCSGGGGPWVGWLRKKRVKLPVMLTDKFPNTAAVARIKHEKIPQLQYTGQPVDATAVPVELRGFRTMFTSFHHFPPELARAIIADAVRKGEGIGIFESTSRSVAGLLRIAFLTPIGVIFLTPCSRNVNWRTLLLTYLIPIIPFVVTIDGLVSCLRTYSPAELHELAGEPSYRWTAGREKGVTFLIGYPKTEQPVNGPPPHLT